MMALTSSLALPLSSSCATALFFDFVLPIVAGRPAARRPAPPLAGMYSIPIPTPLLMIDVVCLCLCTDSDWRVVMCARRGRLFAVYPVEKYFGAHGHARARK